MVIAGEKKDKEISIEKAIGKKLLENKSKKVMCDQAPQASTSKGETASVEEVVMEKANAIETKNEGIWKQVITHEDEEEKAKLDALKKRAKTGKTDKRFPAWLPKLKDGVSIVQPLTEAPRKSNQVSQMNVVILTLVYQLNLV